MDYLTINSEREENDRVLQNLKDAMKQRNLAKMRDAEAELVERYGFYDGLSDKVSLVPFKRRARVFEWERFVKEYKVLKPQLIAITKDLRKKQQLLQEAAARKRYMGRLIQREGESKWEHARRLTTPITQGGAGQENRIWSALEDIAAAELELRGIAPPPNPDEWKCPACNHPDSKEICEMCGEPKPKKPKKFQMLKKSKRKSSRKRKASRKTSRKRRSAKRKTSRKRRSAKRKTSRKRRSSKRKASRKRSRKRRSSKRCPAGCVKKKTSKRKSRKVKKS